MKQVFLLLLFVVFCYTANAQVTKVGNTFKVEKTTNKSTTPATKTSYIYEDSKGNKYPIYITKSGAVFVLKTSNKTGNEYKYYLPKEIKEQIWKDIKFTPKTKKDEK